VIISNLSIFIEYSVSVRTERVLTPFKGLLDVLQSIVTYKFPSDNMQVNGVLPHGISLFPDNRYVVTRLLSFALFRRWALIKFSLHAQWDSCVSPLLVASESVLNGAKYGFFDQDKFICVISYIQHYLTQMKL